jgi:hypothetical protein
MHGKAKNIANMYAHDQVFRTCIADHEMWATAILIIIEGQLQVFQRFSSSKLVLKTVESCFMALNYCGNGSTVLSFS